MITNRVDYMDLDRNEIQEMICNIIDNIVWSNRDFKCEECINTYEKLLQILSLFTINDHEYDVLVEEYNEILYGDED